MRVRQPAIVVSGFAGLGKSSIAGIQQIRDRVIYDLDSSSFSFGADGRRNPRFVEDYVRAILEKLNERCVLLVSTHPDLRKALITHGVLFYLVYPCRDCKKEYLDRFVTRGTPNLVPIFEAPWDAFIDSCEEQYEAYGWRLHAGAYLDRVCLEDIVDGSMQ